MLQMGLKKYPRAACKQLSVWGCTISRHVADDIASSKYLLRTLISFWKSEEILVSHSIHKHQLYLPCLNQFRRTNLTLPPNRSNRTQRHYMNNHFRIRHTYSTESVVKSIGSDTNVSSSAFINEWKIANKICFFDYHLYRPVHFSV